MVSIIVPIYNKEQYLEECISSIVAQTFTDWECILVDDGSTDSSGAICDAWSDKDARIRVVHRKNGGVSAARNSGIEVAKGEKFMFVDCDDTISPDCLELLDAIFDESGCDVSAGKFYYGTKGNISFSQKRCYHVLSRDEALAALLYQNLLDASACCKLFKSSIVRETMFAEGRRYEDLDFMFRILLKVDSVAATDSVVYFYREHCNSFINTFSPDRYDVLTVTDAIEEECCRSLPQLLPAAQDRKLSANFNMFLISTRNNRPIEAHKCWEVVKRYRQRSLWDRNVRLKNKLGILISYLGSRGFKTVAKWVGE